MSGVNKVILIGNLGRDPELKSMPNGNSVCNLVVATSETWKDKNTGEKKEKTEWNKIVAYSNLADICGRYLTKGSKVYIEGKLQTRSYDKDGQTHYVTEIVAKEMTMFDGGQRKQQPPQNQGGYSQYQQQGYGGYEPQSGEDDQIPF